MPDTTSTAPAELPTYFLKTDEIIANLKGLIRYARKGTRRRTKLDETVMYIWRDPLTPLSDQDILKRVSGLRNTSGPAGWATAVDDVVNFLRRLISAATFDDLKNGDEVYFVSRKGGIRTGVAENLGDWGFRLRPFGGYSRSYFTSREGYRIKKAEDATQASGPVLTQEEAISHLKDTIEQAAKEHCEEPAPVTAVSEEFKQAAKEFHQAAQEEMADWKPRSQKGPTPFYLLQPGDTVCFPGMYRHDDSSDQREIYYRERPCRYDPSKFRIDRRSSVDPLVFMAANTSDINDVMHINSERWFEWGGYKEGEAPIAKPAEKTDPVFLDLRPGDMVSLRPDRTKDCKDFVVRHVGHTKNVRLTTVEDSDDDQNVANLTMGRWMAWEGKKVDAAFTMSKADARIKPEHLFDMLQVGDEISVDGQTGKVHTISYASGKTSPWLVGICRDAGGLRNYTLETFVKGNGRLISEASTPAVEAHAAPQAEKKPITIDDILERVKPYILQAPSGSKLEAILSPIYLMFCPSFKAGHVDYVRAGVVVRLLLKAFGTADEKASAEFLSIITDLTAYIPEGPKGVFSQATTNYLAKVEKAYESIKIR